MTKSYKVSIVIPCFNHGEFLPEAVASVTKIARDDIELIVVDDGSTDEGTVREVDKLVAQGIKVIRQGNNGPAGARNAAIRASQGEYILPLDADDRLRSGWIDSAIAILDSDAQVGVVYGDAQCFGTRTDHWRVGPFEADKLLNWNFIHASALLPSFCLGTEQRIRSDNSTRTGRLGFLARGHGARLAICVYARSLLRI